jgi:hypothetical protein
VLLAPDIACVRVGKRRRETERERESEEEKEKEEREKERESRQCLDTSTLPPPFSTHYSEYTCIPELSRRHVSEGNIIYGNCQIAHSQRHLGGTLPLVCILRHVEARDKEAATAFLECPTDAARRVRRAVGRHEAPQRVSICTCVSVKASKLTCRWTSGGSLACQYLYLCISKASKLTCR